MKRSFVMTKEFDKSWKFMGLDDANLKQLQENLLLNPQSGAVMQGTGGLRKLRFSVEPRGKSKSVRVIYIDFMELEVLCLITAYTKGNKENISEKEAQILKKTVIAIKESFERGLRR